MSIDVDFLTSRYVDLLRLIYTSSRGSSSPIFIRICSNGVLIHQRLSFQPSISAYDDRLFSPNLVYQPPKVKLESEATSVHANESESVDNGVSKILMKTTDFEPSLKMTTLLSLAAIDRFKSISLKSKNYPEKAVIFCAGSGAELRIKPMLNCLGDIDVMFHLFDEKINSKGLAGIQTGCENWRERRVEELEGSDSNILFNEIESDLQHPGYVMMHAVGYLSWDSETGRYNIHDKNLPFQFAGVFRPTKLSRHGPAVQFNIRNIEHSSLKLCNLEIDFVRSVRCLGWPSEAQTFLTREKSSGWPSEKAIKEILNAGYDVVQVPHSDYKDSYPEQSVHWRISFSRVEVVLIRSMTDVQQLVYHLLRYFIKHILPENIEILSNYHLKTLLLWTCEQQPSSEWNPMRLMIILSNFIKELIRCMENRKLSHYFIKTCNLLRPLTSYEEVIQILRPFQDMDKMAEWFLNVYVVTAFKENVHHDPSTTNSWIDNLQSKIQGLALAADDEKISLMRSLVTEVIEEFHVRKCVNLYNELTLAAVCLNQEVTETVQTTMTAGRCRFYLQRLPEVDARLVDFFRAIAYLSLADRLRNSNGNVRIGHEIVDLSLRLFFGTAPSVDVDSILNDFQDDNSESYFRKAISVLRIRKSCRVEQFKDLLLELGKVCLIRASESSNSVDIFASLANLYLSALYYADKEYPLLWTNSLVTLSEIGQGYRIEKELLPEIETVEIASGFALLFEYVKTVDTYKGFSLLLSHCNTFQESGREFDKVVASFARKRLSGTPVDFSPFAFSEFLLVEELFSGAHEKGSESVADQKPSTTEVEAYVLSVPTPTFTVFDWCLYGVLSSKIINSDNLSIGLFSDSIPVITDESDFLESNESKSVELDNFPDLELRPDESNDSNNRVPVKDAESQFLESAESNAVELASCPDLEFRPDESNVSNNSISVQDTGSHFLVRNLSKSVELASCPDLEFGPDESNIPDNSRPISINDSRSHFLESNECKSVELASCPDLALRLDENDNSNNSIPIKDAGSQFLESRSIEMNKNLIELFVDAGRRHLTDCLLTYSRDPLLSPFHILIRHYEALNYYRCKQFQESLDICDDICRVWFGGASRYSQSSPLFYVSPFNLLLDENLRELVDKITTSLPHDSPENRRFIFIYPVVIALYTRMQCLLELGKPGEEVAETLNLIERYMLEILRLASSKKASIDISDTVNIAILRSAHNRAFVVYAGKIEQCYKPSMEQMILERL